MGTLARVRIYPRDGGGRLEDRRGGGVCLRAAVLGVVAWTMLAAGCLVAGEQRPAGGGALDGVRHRVVVSTDVGGTDPDDFQSLVYLLVYLDVLDLEGLISSPYGPGRKDHLLEVIEAYERDYPRLRSWSERYPAPEALRALAKQGATEPAPYTRYRSSTEGSEWIVHCARRADPRPLHVLVWGGLEDLAQALHDAPDILPRLRVYFIGGPNKKWSPDAYQYLVSHHPELWFIEANATYRGWFTGGNQSDPWGNDSFPRRYVAGHGALGELFMRKLPTLKMGDAPSVGWLLRGNPEEPWRPGWGGRFVRAWRRPHLQLDRLPTEADRLEVFGILELALKVDEGDKAAAETTLHVENQALRFTLLDDGTLRVRFSPKAVGVYRFVVESRSRNWDGRTGALTVVPAGPDAARQPDPRLPHWWTDDPAPEWAEGGHAGARTVSRWREDYLRDFADRMRRCRMRAPRARGRAQRSSPRGRRRGPDPCGAGTVAPGNCRPGRPLTTRAISGRERAGPATGSLPNSMNREKRNREKRQ
ncbi:nucleoside hydrolase-like domain-containing protein [Limisphaera sp. 4302-co]|uniref:nucleoside hydrolase-like domain-containing protein n=1 Tax=Limisphaera sp. 4302-co TaxID=3400417 RepID=UPI003C2356F2